MFLFLLPLPFGKESSEPILIPWSVGDCKVTIFTQYPSVDPVPRPPTLTERDR